MAQSSAVMPWTLTMPAGSLQQWIFTFTTVDPNTGQNTPFPISASAWEYVVRVNATDTSSPVFSVTPSGNAAGIIAVTSTATLSQIQLTLNPAATAALVPQSYAHTLWMLPGTTSAYTWVTGNLIVQGNAQP